MDPVLRKVLEPGSSRVSEVQREVADDEIIPLGLDGPTGQVVVIKPEARLHFPDVVGDVGR